MKEKDINSLDHTSWRCQYHVVFVPKYRRMAIYKEITNRHRKDIKATMSAKRSRYNRSGAVSRPHTYDFKYSTKV